MRSFELYLYASIVNYICTKHAAMAKSTYTDFQPFINRKKKPNQKNPTEKVLSYRTQNMNKYLSLLLEQPYATVKRI